MRGEEWGEAQVCSRVGKDTPPWGFLQASWFHLYDFFWNTKETTGGGPGYAVPRRPQVFTPRLLVKAYGPVRHVAKSPDLSDATVRATLLSLLWAFVFQKKLIFLYLLKIFFSISFKINCKSGSWLSIIAPLICLWWGKVLISLWWGALSYRKIISFSLSI